MGFSRQEYWSALPFPPPGDFPDPGDQTWISCIGRCILYHWATWEAIHISIYIYKSIYLYIYMEKAMTPHSSSIYKHTHTHTHIYMERERDEIGWQDCGGWQVQNLQGELAGCRPRIDIAILSKGHWILLLGRSVFFINAFNWPDETYPQIIRAVCLTQSLQI